MSAQCYEHRFGYCTNAKTCFNVNFHIGAILAERRVLLGTGFIQTLVVQGGNTTILWWEYDECAGLQVYFHTFQPLHHEVSGSCV